MSLKQTKNEKEQTFQQIFITIQLWHLRYITTATATVTTIKKNQKSIGIKSVINADYDGNNSIYITIVVIAG